ncbi:hypothetical protein ACIBO1_18970 [Micromonospora sp. NPDC049903]|uniref:hypothetical protein n=1 Tax=Micromonospora sp. NPDC049903 TaxID=3364276 RepID=UPI00378DFA86
MRKVGLIIAAVIVVLCGGIGWTVYQAIALGKEVLGAGVTREQFDAQQVGTAESDVRAALPEPLSGMRDKDLYPDDPGRQGIPVDASCAYFTVAPLGDPGPELWRFCFVDGVLKEKRGITIPE